MRIGFIGLGVMGAKMVGRLQDAGFQTVINDIRLSVAKPFLEAGAEWAETPKELAQRSDVIFTCLPGLPQVEAVALGPDGLIEGIRPGSALFEMSTNSLAMVKRLDAAFSAKGAHMLEAPISGGTLGAERGRLAIWVGGDKSIFEKYLSVLKAMGDCPLHVGEVGAGTVIKLVHNCVSQTLYPMLAESFALGVKGGVDPLLLFEAIRQGFVGRRRTFDGMADEFLPADFERPGGALRIMYKDMTIATELGRELGVPMHFANLALSEYTAAMNRGWADRDGRSVMLLAQERSGVRIAADKKAIDDVIRRDPLAPSDIGADGDLREQRQFGEEN